MKGYELVNFCEFDPLAVKSYCAIHGVSESKNLGDITKVDETKLEPFTMICGGSPCQDFSIAGKLNGSKWICKDCEEEYNPLYVHWSKRDTCPNCSSKNIDKTRSSLLVEWLRVVRANKPNWGIYENVKNLVGKEFKETTFKMFLDELREYGYNTYWKVLNAKNYGIPQNRERIYLFLIKKELDNGKFNFPVGFDNGLRLIDFMDKEVDDRYYLKKVTNVSYKSNYVQYDNSGKGYNSQASRGYYKDGYMCTLPYNNGGDKSQVLLDRTCVSDNLEATIRRLTPKECWRLMGFTDEDYSKAEATGISSTYLYKQAGNSIVVDVLYYIYLEIYKAMPYLFDDLKVSSYFSGIGAFEKALDRFYEALDV